MVKALAFLCISTALPAWAFEEYRPDASRDYPQAAAIALRATPAGKVDIAARAGAVAPGAGVGVYNPHDGGFASAQAGPDGAFTASLAAAPGSWLLVRADARGLPPGPHPGFALNAAPGVWLRSPADSRDDGSFRAVLASWEIEGRLSGDLRPGGAVRLSGSMLPAAGAPDAPRKALVRLVPLADASGAAVPESGFFFSTLYTPTGLPVQNHDHGGRGWDGESAVPLERRGDGASFDVSVPLPKELPAGLYALKLSLPGKPPAGAGAGERVQACLDDGATTLPPFLVGRPAAPRLAWVLLLDAFNADSTRGVVAREDEGRFALANHIAVQPRELIIPRLSRETARPLAYRLEPFLPMISQGDQFVPNPPVIPFRFPSGALRVRVRGPSGAVVELGEEPFRAARSATPRYACGDAVLEQGGARMAGVFQLSTESRRFEYEFPADGEYEIEATGRVEDVFGNGYEGGGRYRVVVARSLDVEPATLYMTPLETGDALNLGLSLLPGAPADVEVEVEFHPASDPGRVVRRRVAGRANRFGIFTPPAGTAPVRFDEPGEFVVDVKARHTDAGGALWAASARWGQVVAPKESPLIVRGFRGRNPGASAKLWFESLPGGKAQFPFASGDVLWQKRGDAASPGLAVQDLEGQAEARILSWARAGSYHWRGDAAARASVQSLPLSYATAGGRDPAYDANAVKAAGYWYAGVERPGERIREMVSTDSGVGDNGYWRFDRSGSGPQRGLGPQADLPGDFKFLYGGAVLRETSGAWSRHGIYGALWTRLPDDDERGGRVFPPFRGAAGGPDGGPLLRLAGEDLDAFLVPTAARPGTILETGQTLSFAAALAPTLPGRVAVTIAGPGGLRRSFEGRANPVGYFYDPAQDLVVERPGVYTVTARAIFDAPTSAGTPRPPYPVGRALGTGPDASFQVYAVEAGRAPLPSRPSVRSAVEGAGPARVELEAPSSGALAYTLAMPGYLLKTSSAPVAAGAVPVVYDPAALRASFPNIDAVGPCGKAGLADTVWISTLYEDAAGAYRANRFTLEGHELFPF